jgi:hypothetical protein
MDSKYRHHYEVIQEVTAYAYFLLKLIPVGIHIFVYLYSRKQCENVSAFALMFYSLKLFCF